MKKYIFNRILRSLVSIFLVTTIVYTLVFTLVPRQLIFKQDPNYNKMIKTADSKVNYESNVFEKMGYINYYNSKELQEKASEKYSNVTVDGTDENKVIYEKYIKELGNGWKLYQFEENKQFYAIRQVPIFERVFDFYANLIDIDHPYRIQDETNPDLKRYIRVENDPAIGWSVVGSGTKHKYLLYVNGVFPYIHQNFININLGTSYPTYANIPVLQVITQGQGQTKTQEVNFPTGKKTSSIDIYSRTYKSPSRADSREIANFGEGDPYTETQNNYQSPSMLVNSSIIGIASVIIMYALGIPLGAYMARFKNKWFDHVSTAVLTFIMALPSVALVYILRVMGSAAGLPDSFPILGSSDWRSYALPAIILGLMSVPGLAIWVRRYLIDQQYSDYVRFARAKGLSEAEISRRHIMKNALLPIVSGIPGSILLVITGATLTESVFAFPGMGKMLIDSVNAANNTMVVGLTFIITALSIISLLLGDIWMTIMDPRIKLTDKGGK